MKRVVRIPKGETVSTNISDNGNLVVKTEKAVYRKKIEHLHELMGQLLNEGKIAVFTGKGVVYYPATKHNIQELANLYPKYEDITIGRVINPDIFRKEWVNNSFLNQLDRIKKLKEEYSGNPMYAATSALLNQLIERAKKALRNNDKVEMTKILKIMKETE